MVEYIHMATKTPPYPSIKIVLVIFLGVVILQIPADLIIQDVSLIWGILFNEVVVFLILPIAALTIVSGYSIQLLPFGKTPERRMLLSICLTIGAAVILCYIQNTTSALIPIPDFIEQRQIRPLKVYSWNDFFPKLIVLGMVAPFCEEVFFRGIIQRTISIKWGRWRAIVVTSLFFAFIHSTSFAPHLYLLMGLLFSWIFDVTGSLRTVILCHAINNSWALVNQIHQWSLPRNQPPGGIDWLFMTASVLIILSCIRLLERRRSPRPQPEP